jgi:hypothetical protein
MPDLWMRQGELENLRVSPGFAQVPPPGIQAVVADHETVAQRLSQVNEPPADQVSEKKDRSSSQEFVNQSA